MQADLHEGHAEDRFGRGQAQVRTERQAHARARRGALDRGHHGLGQGGQAVGHRRAQVQQGFQLCPVVLGQGLRDPPEVAARAEGPPRAPQDQRLHARLRGLRQGLLEALLHLRHQGVQLVRPVQRQRGDAVADLEADRRGHGNSKEKAMTGFKRINRIQRTKAGLVVLPLILLIQLLILLILSPF